VNSREFIFDIQDNIVGRKVYTFDELIQVISTNDYTMDTTARQKILDKFWGKTSGKNSCELVFEKLQLLD
jgi:CDP-glycerol glycerophosphotransferase (TagB/SpsB family)